MCVELESVSFQDGGNLSLTDLPWDGGCQEPWVQMLALPGQELDPRSGIMLG